MVRDTFLVFGQPDIQEEEIKEVEDTLRSGWISTGPKVKRFEKDFAHYKNVEDAIALSSCTASIFMALLAAEVGPGDEVITSAFSFVSTVNTILHVGATPVLIDVDPVTLNIDMQLIQRAITDRTKAIILVHYAGRPCEMNELCEVPSRITIIEDAAHAIEATYHGKPIGTLGDFGCFSFYATKNLTTAEGGMLLCKEQSLVERIRIKSLHGLSADAYKRFTSKRSKQYLATDLGYKLNMTDIQAALGIHQLRRIDENWKKRESIWNSYMDGLKDTGLLMPAPTPPYMKHAHHLFSFQVTELFGMDRDSFIEEMRKRNIGCGIHYASIADHPYHQKALGITPEQFHYAQQASKRIVSIPLSSKLTGRDIDDVIEAIHEIKKEAKDLGSGRGIQHCAVLRGNHDEPA